MNDSRTMSTDGTRRAPGRLAAIGMRLLPLILPFLFFFWMIPFVSRLTIGSDYVLFPTPHQMELMFSIKMGSFPLYVPGFCAGQSASALTLGQIYHPISHIASMLPGYWTGKALEWNTLLRLVSLGLAHLALFGFLRRLNLGTAVAFLVSMVTVYNLRMLDLFRYGASLESWTGHLFLCVAIGWHCLKPSRWFTPLLIAGSTYWLITSGHPQMTYYGLLGAFLFTLVIPFFLSAMLPDRKLAVAGVLRFVLDVGVCCALGVLLSAAFLAPFYVDFLATNVERVGQDYAWADAYRDTFMGTLSNFFLPLRADGSMFGGSALFLACALLPLLGLFRAKAPRVVWVIWGLGLLVFLHAQGARTPVHYAFWKCLPFASSFRIAGRVTMILPVLLMLILAWALRSGPGKSAGSAAPAMILGLSALVLTALYAWLPSSMGSDLVPHVAAAIQQTPAWVEPAILAAGAATLAILALGASNGSLRTGPAVALCICAFFQVACLLRYGNEVEPRKDTPTFQQMLAEKKENLDYRGSTGFGVYSAPIRRQLARSNLEPFPGKVYPRWLPADSNDKAYELMARDRAPDQVVIETDSNDLAPAGGPATEPGANTNATVALAYSSYNRLLFDVRSTCPGFFQLSCPYTGLWTATVNGGDSRVYRANGAYAAVQIPSGHSRLEFKYRSPAAFWGVVVSCGTLVLIGLLAAFTAPGPGLRLAFPGLCVLSSAALFAMFNTSLYSGEDIGTVYKWKSPPPERLRNLAHGRVTWMSSVPGPSVLYPHLYHSGRGVDGDYDKGSGFCTGWQNNPVWGVDLGAEKTIGSIVGFERGDDPTWNVRPVSALISSDRKHWRTAGEMSGKGDRILWLDLDHPEKARFVAIRGSGTGRLAFDEVEVYPPDKE